MMNDLFADGNYMQTLNNINATDRPLSCVFRFLMPPVGLLSIMTGFSYFLSVSSPISERYCAVSGVVSLTAGPQPFPKRVLHTVQSSASSLSSCIFSFP
jgi:hypothetical protein